MIIVVQSCGSTGPNGKIPAIGVPSASASVGGLHHPAAYNLLSIEHQNSGWTIQMVVRGLTGTGIIETVQHKTLL